MNPMYAYWSDALAGKNPKAMVDHPQPGFYRSGVRQQMPLKNGQGSHWKRVGWEPVAIFMEGPRMTAAVGIGHAVRIVADQDKLNELWTYCCAQPISEETYRAVAERGEPWSDSHETVPSIPVSNGSTLRPVPEGALPTSPHNLISDQIDEAAKQLAKYATIDSDEQSSKARSLQQRFLDLRSEAEKHYNDANRPLLTQQKELRLVWFPLRDKADDASNKLRAAMGAWEDKKREAAKVAAERAEAGQPVQSNVPPPSTQIRSGAGRAAAVKVETIITDIDVLAVATQFKDSLQLRECLMKIAQAAIKAGVSVPGATTEERSVVR